MRLLIENGTVVHGDHPRLGHVLCEGGTIVDVLDDARGVSADERYDARGQLVFPGLIDPHVHSRDPGQTAKEDFAHSTAAALASGITTVLEMPNALPPVTTVEVFGERVASHEQSAWTDFGLWGQAIGSENSADLGAIFGGGAVAVKLFWGYALDRVNRRLIYNLADAAPEDLILPPDLGAVLEIFRQTAATGGVIAAHCEDRELLEEAATRTGVIATYDDLLAARPAVAETASVALGIELARVTGARFHVVHVSSARTIELIEQGQRDGVHVTGEACTHYLTLDAKDAERIGPASKVFPPIRDAAEQAALWAGIESGAIVSVGSDHAPHAPEEKAGSLAETPAGVHGVETMVPLLLDRMTSGHISPQRVAQVLSTRTAELYGLAHRKGTLRPGADADLTIVDPEKAWKIDQAKLHTLHRTSIFHGRQGRGQAVASILGGEVAMLNGEPVGTRRGRFVPAAHLNADAKGRHV